MKYFRRILVCYSPEKDKCGVIANQVAEEAKILHNPIIPSEVDIISVDDTFVVDKMYDLAISVGGDGTLLRLAHLMSPYSTPIIGVNLGRRGFMPEIEKENIKFAFEKINKGEFTIKNYPYLFGSVNDDEDFDIAVNDIFICKAQSLKTVELSLFIDDTYVEDYICDGILVSSAFGSTAYNRALNGSVVHPDCPVFVITPVGTADKKFQSLVVPNTSHIKIVVSRCGDKGVEVGFDGTQAVFGLKENDVLEILDNSHHFKMIHLDSFDYYENIRRKLG